MLAVNVAEFDPFEAPQDDEGETQRRQTQSELTTAKHSPIIVTYHRGRRGGDALH